MILAGQTVLDFGGWKAALTGKLLGDLGADVIAVEDKAGSEVRQHAPYLDAVDHADSRSGHSLAFNSNKRSLAIDFEAPEAAGVVARLVDRASFVIEALPLANVLELGLTYDKISQANKSVILVSVSPFGRQSTDELADTADGLAVAAASGFLYTTGTPARPPVMISGEQAYLHAAAYAGAGAILAHRSRRLRGEGIHVDVSAQEALSLALGIVMPAWQVDGRVSRRVGNALPGREHPKSVWACSDGFVTFDVATGRAPRVIDWMEEHGEENTEELRLLVEGMDIARDSKEKLKDIESRFARFLVSRTKQEAWEAALAKKFMMFPVNTLEEVLNSPVHADRGFFRECHIEATGEAYQYPRRSIPSIACDPAEPPYLGQDTVGILKDLGFEPSEIEALWRTGVI